MKIFGLDEGWDVHGGNITPEGSYIHCADKAQQ